MGIKLVKLLKFNQNNPVQSEVEALFAVIIPIIKGLLYSLKRDIVEEAGGHENISLGMLTRLYNPGDGDCGICFEYAVHDAINNSNPDVLERINTALSKYFKIKVGDPASILFGAEKSGIMQLIDTSLNNLTDNSTLLTGSVGPPIKLKKHIQGVLNAFRKPSEREKLPNSINGLWKADLFVGKSEEDRWIGTTVKSNPRQLEGARGLRLAIVPSHQGKSDKIYYYETKNLIVCPMPYDESFVEIFYQGWNDVKLFFNAKAKVPSEGYVPHGDDRFVLKQLEDRSRFPVLKVLDALEVLKQPHLLNTTESSANIVVDDSKEIQINSILAPVSFYE